MTLSLTPAQRQRILEELASRTQPLKEMSDEELMALIQRGEALARECDPEYAEKFAPRKKKGAA